jgi:hypothetical protein
MLLFACFILLLLVGLITDIVALYFHIEVDASSSIETEIIGFVFSIPVFYLMVHHIFNRYPGIRITRNNLEVQVFDHFHYTWRMVPWEMVRAIYPIIKFGWLHDHKGRSAYLIEINRLSSWHRQISLMFGNGRYHALIVNTDFPGSETLVDVILHHLPVEET